MLLVLDTNEYIFAFGAAKQPASVKLLDRLLENPYRYTIRVPRLIVEELRRNLSGEVFREVLALIQQLTVIDEDVLVPFELGAKYEQQGFKSADAFIAAYVEWVGAEVLVSENRHFLHQHPDVPFRVLRGSAFLAHPPR